jgi:signal transduction histidine kinase
LRRLPPPAVDTAIAVVCYLATVGLPVKASAAGWSLFVLAGLAALPLVWRRRYPVVVAALVGAGTVGLAATRALDGIPLPYGQLVATYTVAALAGPLWRALVMVATGVGLVVSVLPLLGQRPSMLGVAALPFVAAYALGSGVRDRTRRVAEQQQAAAVAERQRIARDIHDIVAHSVSVMVVQAEAGAVLATDPDKALAGFETISAAGRQALTQLDRALGVLRGDRPTRHPQPGLGDVPDLLEQARLTGLDATLDVRGTRRPVPADLAAAVFRLVQEATTNTIRHAQAHRVEVRLDWRDDELRLDVVDDGRGRAPSTRDGHGLVGMRERVNAFGGRLQTGTAEGGRGFRVSAVLPLDAVGGPADA